MKKLLFLLLILLIIFGLTACDIGYSSCNDDSLWHFYGSRFERRAFVTFYNFYKYLEDTRELTIPDEVDGMPVEGLGGYHTDRSILFGGSEREQVPFYIDLTWYFAMQPDIFVNQETFWLDDPELSLDIESYEMVYMDFTLHIGKNINEIVKVSDIVKRVKLADGSFKLYRVRYYFVCDEENPIFYSENGRLYYRGTEELVEEFCYVNP